MIFSLNYNVFAEETGTGITSDASGTDKVLESDKKDDKANSWYSEYPIRTGDYSYVRGIRVSFVTNEGKDIASYDYILDSQLTDLADKNDYYYISSQRCSKAAYTSRKCSSSTLTSASNWVSVYKTDLTSKYSTIGNLSDKFTAYNFKDADVKDKIGGEIYDTHSFVNSWFKKNSYQGNSQYYNTDLKNLLKSFGVPDDYFYETEESKAKLERLFLVVEPLTSVVLNKKNYIGTSYELALLAKNTSSNIAGRVDGLNDLYTLLRFNVPCSAYVNGNINAKVSEQKKNISGFSGNYYFGSIIIDDNYINTCNSGNHLSKDQVTKNYGVGMAVIWIYESIGDPPPDPTCNDVHLIAGYNRYDRNNLLKCENVSALINSYNNKVMNDPSYGFPPVTEKWYKNNCHCDGITEGPDCTPYTLVGACDKNYQVAYKDIENESDAPAFWQNCIYNSGTYEIDVHKTPTSGAYTYLDTTLTDGNRYCQVYCTESVGTNFTVIGANNQYKAGYHITWPTGTTVSGSRTCKVKLDTTTWNTYQTELNTAAVETIKQYNAYNENKAKESLLSSFTKTDETCGCKQSSSSPEDITCFAMDANSAKHVPEGSSIENMCNSTQVNLSVGETYNGYEVKEIYTSASEATAITSEGTEIRVTGTTFTFKFNSGGVCSSYYYYYTGNSAYSYTKYTRNTYTGDITSSTATSYLGFTKKCESDLNTLKSEASTAKTAALTAYQAAQSNASAYIQQMQKCYTWSDASNKNNVYNLNPTVELDYVDTGYAIPENLKKLDSSVVSENYIPTLNCRDNENDDYYYSCNDDGCTKKEHTVRNCSYNSSTTESTVIAVYDKTIGYSLNSNLYRYVTKGNNLSTILAPATGSYIYMGYGNIPIAYGTPDDTYDISFKYSKLGHMDNTSLAYTAVDRILEQSDVDKDDDYGNWNCKYSIVSELIPEETDNSGIDVIYRPIDLVNPFPDMDGDGRKVGSNWCDGNICHNENDLIKAIITEYDMPSEPMYSFILTPSIIQQIRKYNSSNSYLDFNLKCEGQTGRACVSEFVTQMINGNLNNSSFNAQASGTCVYRSLARDNRASNFYSVCKRDYYY